MAFFINRFEQAGRGISKATARQQAARLASLAVMATAFCIHTVPSLSAPGLPSKKTDKKQANKPVVKTKIPVAPSSAPAVLNYQFTPGATYHFSVAALFDGHFPPFAVGPDSPPVHFKADLGYLATVRKVDQEGATVDFVVDSRALYLFEHEMAENEKMDMTRKDIAPLDGLTSLEDIQKALNASVILRPDGTIVRILSKSSVKIPFDVGFDIRKLFLMMLPITFPTKAVKPGDTWPAADGLLGSKPGTTNYTDRLDSIAASGNAKTYLLHQSANSIVSDKLDKAGNSTTKEEDAYRLLSGKVDLTTETKFVAAKPQSVPANPANANNVKGDAKVDAKIDAKNKVDTNIQAGQIKSAHLVMNAVINRKRVKINPEQPEIPENDPLDVKARMTITRDEVVAKPVMGDKAPDTQPKAK